MFKVDYNIYSFVCSNVYYCISFVCLGFVFVCLFVFVMSCLYSAVSLRIAINKNHYYMYVYVYNKQIKFPLELFLNFL